MNKWPRFGFYAIGFVFSIVFLSILTKAWHSKNHILNDAVHNSQLIQLPKGASAKTLARILLEKHLIDEPYTLLFLIQQNHIAKFLKSGVYQIQGRESVWDLVLKMTKGQVYKVPLRIIEGKRICEIVEQFEQSKDYYFNKNMLSALPQDHASLEGMLYPSTYLQPYGESILPVLKLAYQTMAQKLNAIWAERDQNLPYRSPYELLIAASIIEKETADPLERQLISGVIINRLRLGMPLQMDPTVSYALSGCQHVILGGSDLKKDSPYNSYLHQGLPPTPIAMVSLSSLFAAAHPKASTYLYFVAKGDGHHVFSSEYIQQQQAINRYIRKLHD